MTTQANIPQKWYVPFAQGDGARVEIPVTTADPTRASQTLGFPPLTMQPPESGGVPPQGEDFNGGMNQVARVCWWVLNGGGWPYDATFATQANILGYPNGATLQSADFRGNWISTIDSNQNNPDTTGTGWVPGFQYGVTELSSLTGGTVTPTPAQAAKGTITLAGTLTSALTVILPTWLNNWVIINNTTGAFVTIVKTAAGSGVTIPQSGTRIAVVGDGTNIVSGAVNVGGSLLRTTMYVRIAGVQNVIVNGGTPTTSGAGTFTAHPLASYAELEGCGGGGAGGGAAITGAAQISVGAGGGAAAYFEARFTAAQITGSAITIGLGGTGSSGNSGNNGVSTSIGALITAPGGVGGQRLGPSAAPLYASSSPSTGATGGLINSTGAAGELHFGFDNNNGYGGNGGTSPYGGGGARGPSTDGTAGVSPGSGGGGCVNPLSTGTARTGGAGAPGIVIIREYA